MFAHTLVCSIFIHIRQKEKISDSYDKCEPGFKGFQNYSKQVAVVFGSSVLIFGAFIQGRVQTFVETEIVRLTLLFNNFLIHNYIHYTHYTF